MKSRMNKFLFVCLLLVAYSCNNMENKPTVGETNNTKQEYARGSFGYDLNFLQQYHKDLVLLQEDSNDAQVAILPGYQGRVMTSTATGNNGTSFGWINHELIASGRFSEHMSAFGGEDRFWLGPEGGQFSIYFKKGTAFKFDNWFVPAAFDTEPFTLVASDKTTAKFEKEMHLENYSGNKFDVQVNRIIRLLNKQEINGRLGGAVSGDIQAVGFESVNSITNIGKGTWTKQTGMLSIWILSMMKASEKTTVAIPYKQGDDAKLGKIVTDDYFGKVPADRLKVKDGLIYFKADANYRSKIGLSPARALPLAASYDSINNVLTIAQFDLPEGATDYVNSLWQLQDHPFAGDAVNSYNDGPIDGKQMGRFYEVESSSPAASLKPGESIQHIHRTIHLKGDKKDLDKITMKLLGVTTDAIAL
jgi:hypothetical protein